MTETCQRAVTGAAESYGEKSLRHRTVSPVHVSSERQRLRHATRCHNSRRSRSETGTLLPDGVRVGMTGGSAACELECVPDRVHCHGINATPP